MNEIQKSVLLGHLRTFLAQFPKVSRDQGRRLAQSGDISEFLASPDGTTANAVIQGQDPTVEFDDLELEWFGDCGCGHDFCAHQFALASLLANELSQAAVRQISSGHAKVIPPPKAAPPSDFTATVKARLQRTLRQEELRLCQQISQLYARCRPSERLSAWDLHDLGLQVSVAGWETLKPWQSFPATEWEFWLFIAHTLLTRNGILPDFLAPITDLEPIREILHQVERAKLIEKWKAVFDTVPPEIQDTHAAGGHDLRLVAEPDELLLEIRIAGDTEFRKFTATKARELRDSEEGETLWNSAQSEVIWNAFNDPYRYGSLVKVGYEDEGTSRLVRFLLRNTFLASHVVDEQRQPLQHHEEPLKWTLIVPPSEHGEYTLQLTQSNGTPVPPVYCVLPGQPFLFLTRAGMFKGPPAPGDFAFDRGNRIPAAALEHSKGVEFLLRLGVELPERLRERLRTIPYKVIFECRLEKEKYRPQNELCRVSVRAESADGEVLGYDGTNWYPREKARAKRLSNQEVVIHDRQWLLKTPGLLAPLQLRVATYPMQNLWCKVTRAFPETFSNWVKSLPPQIELVLKGELSTLANPEVAGSVRLEVQETQIDWFDLRVILQVEDTSLTPEETRLLLKARGGFVRLAGRGWRKLQYNLSPEEDERLAGLGLSPHELSDEPQRLHALQLADEGARKFLPPEQVEQIHRRASEIRASVSPPLPSGIDAQFRPYQLDGFQFLAYLSTNHFGGILADDMGLGKTLQTLAWLLWLRETGVSSPPTGVSTKALVVCPKSVMDNWQAEAARFAGGLRVRVWSASELPKFKQELESADLHVINYSQLRTLETDLLSLSWLAVILDEGQYIKNPNSQTAQIARTIKAGHRLILTGTPIENRLLDLWSLMSFAMPGALGNRASFLRVYDAKTDPLARRRLAARVRPFLLRRTKSQVAKDLPDRVEEDLFCEMEGEQKTLYRAELKRAQQMLLRVQTQQELAKQTFHFLTSMLRLRQICCDPRLVNPEVKADSAKMEALLDQLEPLMEEGHKVLVFSQFVELLDLLKPVLEKKGWPVYYLVGATENRGDLVKDFQSHSGAAIFLISLKAGGFGLNLTSASYVVLFDPWWNPAVENQAIDRTHRIGQTRKVIAYRLLIKGSIEEKIRELQKQKRALMNDVLGEEKFSQQLTLQDLQFLFSD